MLNRKAFFDAIRGTRLFPRGIPAGAVAGAEAILDEWETGKYGDNLLDLAYALAITYHETAGTIEPIEEYGKGRDATYGDEYGRGFVQLTWHTNYVKMERAAGIKGLSGNYALALDPANAAKILLIGMRDGLFRKHKLADFDLTTDKGVFDARNIINGDKNYSDKQTRLAGVANRGELVASYFRLFRDALLQAAQAPVVVEPDFIGHPKMADTQAPDADQYDDLPPMPQEYYDWLAEKRKQKQAEAYAELNRKPLVKSGVTGFVAGGFVSFIAAVVSQQVGVDIPPEAKDWLYGTIITVMGSGALWKRFTATKLITGILK